MLLDLIESNKIYLLTIPVLSKNITYSKGTLVQKSYDMYYRRWNYKFSVSIANVLNPMHSKYEITFSDDLFLKEWNIRYLI